MDGVTLVCTAGDGPCAQRQRTHGVKVHILRRAGPNGDGRGEQMGGQPARSNLFLRSPLSRKSPSEVML